MKVLNRTQHRVALGLPPIAVPTLLLLGLMAAAAFTRFWRLGTPDDFFFDEIYYAFTAREYLDGNKAAWEFFASAPEGFAFEWTHPPLSKLFMAGGMIFLGENSFGWRFFGALAGTGAVFFTYLLGKRLFKSEVVALSAAFLMTVEGLLFAQSRLATADVYLVFFILGSLYFLVSDRYLLSGTFLGAALATKWSAGLLVLPIAFYFAYRYLQTERANRSSIVLAAALILPGFYVGTPILADYLSERGVSFNLTVFAMMSWVGLWTVLPLASYFSHRWPQPQTEQSNNPGLSSLWILPTFFIAVPLIVYALSYVPFLLSGHDLGDLWDLQRQMYWYHTGLDATHPYQSLWFTWPFDYRPVYLYVSGDAQIYALGNPIIFWLGLPALAFALWQALRKLRVRLRGEDGKIAVSGRFGGLEFALLFLVVSYLSFLLPWARVPRIVFIYHYLPAVPFLALALGYAVHSLWRQSWGRAPAIAFLVLAGATFVYFYPHLAAVPVPDWLRDSYFWFDSWR